MLLKIVALGALGYLGYKYVQKNGGFTPLAEGGSAQARPTPAGDRNDPHLATAGGPLSQDAVLVHAGDPLPAT